MESVRSLTLVACGALGAILSAHTGSAAPLGKQPPQLKKILQGAKTASGFYTLHWKGHEGYLEVPSGQMNRPFLMATSISGGPTYAGFQWRNIVCTWMKTNGKLLLMEKEVRYQARNRGKPMASVVPRTFTDRLLVASPIVALNGSNPVISLNRLFAGQAKTFFGRLGAGFDGSVVLLGKMRAYPRNVELTLTVPDRRRKGRLTSLSYSLSSISPSGGFRPRKADDRVGYFLTALKDFTDETAGGDRFVRYINRWHLQKADHSLPQSPVKTPIIFYVEKTVPYRFRQAVFDGILEWNKAFAKVGLLGAIKVRQQTRQEFNDLEPEDVRYNFFRWIVSERAFAMGPSRVNPWTGQILDADIVFDESMVRAYLREYDLAIRETPRNFFSPGMRRMLDADPLRFAFAHPHGKTKQATQAPFPIPNADRCGLGPGIAHQVSIGFLSQQVMAGKKGKFPQAFMNAIVKDVVMHEVGHTLGLRHNFKASTWRSLEEINGKARPADQCASVMDYNPINIPANPKALKSAPNYTMRTLGPYDYWAINFGYHPSESKARASIARVASPQFAYGTDEDTWGPDPHVARWDLGKDPLRFSAERMNLASSLWSKALGRVVKKGQGYRTARRAIDMLLFDYLRAALAATRFVGGQHTYRDHKGDPQARPPLVPVAAKTQKAALELLCKRVFDTGNFVLPPKLLQHLGKGYWSHWGSRDASLPHSYPYHRRILTIQSWILWGLINPSTLQRLVDTEAKLTNDAELLTVPAVLNRLTRSIFGGKLQGVGTARKPLIPTIQRNLQRQYVSQLISMTLEGEHGRTPPSVRTVARLEVQRIAKGLDILLKLEKEAPDQLKLDPYTKGHIAAMAGRIKQALKATYRIKQGK